jgi:hypothetical protein
MKGSVLRFLTMAFASSTPCFTPAVSPFGEVRVLPDRPSQIGNLAGRNGRIDDDRLVAAQRDAGCQLIS